MIKTKEKRCCSVGDCKEKHYALGMCSKHYTRKWRYGSVDVVNPKIPKGFKHTEESKKKMSKARTGWVMSQKGRDNLSKATLGRTAYNKGKRTPKHIVDNMRGKNHWNWQGGKTTVSMSVRNCFEYKVWRTTIFQRDNYKCTECGCGGILNVDHYPKSFSEIISEYNIKSLDDALDCKELWDLENNRTLCLDCHKKTPTYLNGAFVNK